MTIIGNRPTLMRRARIALDVFRYGLPWNKSAIERKKSAYMWPAWKRGKPEWQIVDYQTYVESGFNLNSLLYQAIMYKSKAVSSVKFRAYKGDEEAPEPLPPEHELSQLVARPNKHQSFVEFQMLQTVYLNLAGNAYTLLDRPRAGGIPRALHPLRPDRVFVIPKGKDVVGYLYVPEGKAVRDGMPILPQDMMHVKFPNALDPYEGQGYGLSPCSPLARSADVDNQITEFLKDFFDSGTMLNTYITFDYQMDEDVVEQTRERFKEVYGGSKNWSEVGIFDSGGKVDRFGMNFNEMGFDALDERNESRILGPLGVPLTLLTTRAGMKAATYNNKVSDRTMFWEDTMIPESKLHESEYQYYLQGEDGSWVKFDYSSVPALRKDMPPLIDAAYKLWQMGETRNNAYSIVGIDAPVDTPGGDESYVPFGMVRYGSEPKPEPQVDKPPVPEAEEEEEDEDKQSKASVLSTEKKEIFWKAHDRLARYHESAFADAAEQMFTQELRDILALVNDAKKKSLERKATVNYDELIEEVMAYLDDAPAEWLILFLPLIEELIKAKAIQLNASFGFFFTTSPFDIVNVQAVEWYDNYILNFAQDINLTTKETISAVLQQGMEEGWSIPNIQKNLTTLFDQWMGVPLSPDDFEWFAQRMPPHRTEMIARTETIRASNAGSMSIYESWGVEKHEWLSTLDDRVRTPPESEYDHLGADGEVVEIGKPFMKTGGPLMYPLDPAGAPGNTINCRCTTIPVVPGFEDDEF